MSLAGAPPNGWRAAHAITKDNRVVRDRLHANNNRDHQDYSFLNAVGAVWAADINQSAAGYLASTGFLIDRCHVLTNLHTLYTDDLVVNPPNGKAVFFGVGETEGFGNRGALQGLKFVLRGVVIAHGDAVILDHFVHRPESDWAVIRLEADVDDSIRPLTLATADLEPMLENQKLSIAGFPADLRTRRRDRLELKDLWESEGEVVRVIHASTAGAVIESTIQATRGSSGSPLYGNFDGFPTVVGMHQGIRGNGIDVSAAVPNLQILFTPVVLTSIRAATDRRPCT